MSRFGGMPNFGGMPDIQKLAKQAQKMQEDAAKLQSDLETVRVTAQAGGGMVTATVNGHGHLVEIKINAAVVDPNDIEMLEDLVVTATRDAAMQAQTEQEARMKEITGSLEGLNLPPGLF